MKGFHMLQMVFSVIPSTDKEGTSSISVTVTSSPIVGRAHFEEGIDLRLPNVLYFQIY